MERFVLIFLLSLAAVSCGTGRKAQQLRKEGLTAQIAVADSPSEPLFKDLGLPKTDSEDAVTHEFQGRQVIVMNAVRDEVTGEMVANETLQAARVTARFRNVAERHGKVDICFQVIVPSAMQDSRWQVRFHPQMEIMDETRWLDDILITGRDYRRAQLRGYQQYERFLRSIVTDTTRFIDIGQLNLFIRRNIPALYALRADSSFVSDEQFASIYGVTERQAVAYYTYGILVRRNNRRIRDREKMFRRYVKSPLQTEGLRLDTLMVNDQGEFVYNYVQTIATRPGLRKVDIRLAGEIFEQDKQVYEIPASDPLSFYISSLSTLVDGRERYLDKVVSRRVDLEQTARIRFEAGRDAVHEGLGDNASEIASIKHTLSGLLGSDEFELDSIVVTAHSSPEGSFKSNGLLSQRRGLSVGRYFSAYMRSYLDSLRAAEGVRMDIDGTLADAEEPRTDPLPMSSYAVAENWEQLDRLVDADTVMTPAQKDSYRALREISDPDRREFAMRSEDYYRYMSRTLYPELRQVSFLFHLHRRDMLQETVHTTVVDTVYMAGVQAIRDRDYKKAISLLRPYADYNTAIAYCSLDYNASALSVLEKLERTPEVCYMMALLHARGGDDVKAVDFYEEACRGNASLRHRGNLDPEISALVRRYKLNLE